MNNISPNLQKKIDNLPQKSGVYIMYDCDGNIIYIGKAVILKNRVRQYFQNSKKPPKVAAMMERVADFDIIITISEMDALILEANLIKQHRPQYNILLKDDKSAPYIRIDRKANFAKIEVTRKIKADGAKYFGPFVMGVPVREVVDIIKSAYQMRSCSSYKLGQRACLNHHIGLCLAPCQGNITQTDYDRVVDKVCAFLGGRDDDAERLIKERMEFAASNEEFERAIFYRDRLMVLQKLKEKTAGLNNLADMDFFAYATERGQAAISVLFVRGGKISAVKNFAINDIQEDEGAALANFALQFYTQNPIICEEIAFSKLSDNIEVVTEFLRNSAARKVSVVCPKQGAKARLLETARQNAADYLNREQDKIARKQQMTTGAVEQLQRVLNLRRSPIRMECFDISNISGVDSVASMTVCYMGEADKKSYRRFKIKTVEGANDYLSMKEVIFRRLKKLHDMRFGQAPDLIVIDGGKGQLGFAIEAREQAASEMNEDRIRQIEFIGLAESKEEVYLEGEKQPIYLPRNSDALKLLIRLRDEAHRFAVSYHRSLRGKKYVSELLSIEGVGQATVTALFDHFKDINKIKAASQKELCAVPKVNKKAAQSIYNYFNNKEEQ